MEKFRPRLLPLLSATVLLGSAIFLTACGSDNNPVVPASSSSCAAGSVCGTAATGAAMAGADITAKCKGGLTIPATADSFGYYNVQPVPIEKLPCIIEAKKGATTLYSFTSGSGNFSNITLLSTLMLTKAFNEDPSTTFNTLDDDKLNTLTGTAFNNTVSFIRDALTDYAVPANFNPITTPLTAATSTQAGNFYDFLLDRFSAANLDMSALISATIAGNLASAIQPPPATFSISGNVFGLASGAQVSWILKSNGLWKTNGSSGNGAVTFTPSGSTGGVLKGSYEIQITSSPIGQKCLPSTNITGTISDADITGIIIGCVNDTSQAPEGSFQAAFNNSWSGTYTLSCDTETHQFVIQKDGKATLDGSLFLENGMAYGGRYELSRAVDATTASDVLTIGSLPQKAVKLLFVDGVFNKPLSIKNGSSPAESCSTGTFTPAVGVAGSAYKLETLFSYLSTKFGSPRAMNCKQSSFATGSITASLSSSGISLSSNPVQSYTLSGASVVQRFDGSSLSYNTEITLKNSNNDTMYANLNLTSSTIDTAAISGNYNDGAGLYSCQ